MQEDQEVTLDLRDILKSFRKHIGLIVICGLVATIFGAVYTFFIATPVYNASTQLISKVPESDSTSQVNGTIQLTNTINEVVVSRVILDQVQENLNLTESVRNKVTATSDANSQITTITVSDENPYTAQKIANETANVFSQKAPELINVTNVSILSTADVERTPVSPKPKMLIPLSLIIGLAIGAGIVLIMEAFNNKITTEEQLEALGFPLLGSTQFINLEEFLADMETSGRTKIQVRNKVLKKVNVSIKSGNASEE